MKTVIVYESMYGNTHHVADAIREGIGSANDVVVVAVEHAEPELVKAADLLVVGGPTHAHGMSRSMTRKAAVEAAEKPDSDLELEPDAESLGIREWLNGLDRIHAVAAAFDTRMTGPPALTGRASKGIARRLRHLGASMLCDPESFLVTKENHLVDDEEQRARAWGAELARTFSDSAATPAGS
ncbi:MAG: flavodoxin family protein [Acidimicrobiia bacterium]